MKRWFFLMWVTLLIFTSCQEKTTDLIQDKQQGMDKSPVVMDRQRDLIQIDEKEENRDKEEIRDSDFPVDALNTIKAAYMDGHIDAARKAKGYSDVVALGVVTIEYCRKELMKENTDQMRRFYEMVISETIRQNFPQDIYAERQEYFETTLNEDCSTYGMIGDAPHVWSELKEDTIIQVTEMLNMDWYVANRVSSAGSEEDRVVDGVDFLIQRKYFDRSFEWEVMGYKVPRLEYLQSFNRIVVSDKEAITDSAGRSYVKIPVYDQPTESSTYIGDVYAGDLLKPALDDFRRPITKGEWTLVDIIPYDWCINSNSAWIRNECLAPVTKETRANAGYVLAGTKLYEVPDYDHLKTDSIETNDVNFTDPFRYGDVYCIRILGEDGDFYQVSDEINGVVHGYVEKDDVLFYIDDTLMDMISNPMPDMEVLASRIRDKMISGQCEISAEDLGIKYDFSEEEMAALAGSLTSLADPEGFDSGIRPYREAAYPYVKMDLGDGNLILTEDQRLLLTFSQKDAYKYGVGTRQMPIRYVTPNEAFIVKLNELLAAPENNQRQDMLYLLNANSLEIYNPAGELMKVTDRQVHINHSVRAIRNVLGKASDNMEEEKSEEVFVFRYTMDDGEIIEIRYVDRMIQYDKQWYQAVDPAVNTIGNMFAGYF